MAGNTVAEAWVSILPTTKGFGNALSGQVGGEAKSAGSRVGKGFGMAFGAAGAIAGAAGIGGFLKGAVDEASDLVEATSKTQVVFGKAADEIMKFSDGGAKAFGQTKNEVLAAASTFGTFGKAAGLSGKELAGFSTDFVSLSADLASFHNATPQEAVDALGAALRGEAEPMRRFGVLLDDASLKAEAMKQGLISTTKDALTPQQKTLAAQALIMKQTKDAQGDFARTSDGLANKQRILSASFGDLQAKVGGALLPTVTTVVGGLVSLVDTVGTFGPQVKQVGGFLSSAFDLALPAVQSLAGTVGSTLWPILMSTGQTLRDNFVPVFERLAGVITTSVLPVVTSAGNAFMGFLPTLIGIGQQVIAIVVPNLARLANVFVGLIPVVMSVASYIGANLFPIFQKVADIVSTRVLPIVSSLAAWFTGTLLPAVVSIVTAIGTKLKPVFDQLVATFNAKVLPAVEKLLVKFREWQPTIQRVITVVVKIIGKVLEFAAAILGKVLPPLIRFGGWLLGTAVTAISTVIGWIVKIIAKVLDFGRNLIDGGRKVGEFANKISEKIGDVIGYFEELPGKIKEKLSNAKTMLLGIGEDIVNGLLDGLDKGKQWVIDKVQELGDLVPNWLKKKLGIHSPSRVTRELGGHTADGFAEGIMAKSKVKQTREAVEKHVNAVKSGLATLKGEFTSLRDSVASAFTADLFGAESLSSFFEVGNGSLANLQTMQAALDKLQGMGASSEFLSGLFESGNSALIGELAAAPADQLAAAEAIFAQQQSLTQALGNDVAKAEYGQDIKAMTRELKELRRDLAKMPEKTGKAVGDTINNSAANAAKGGGGKKG